MTDYERGLRNNLEAEVARLRALVQHWRFSQHPDACPCKLCARTTAELPDLPYYPEHGLSKATGTAATPDVRPDTVREWR